LAAGWFGFSLQRFKDKGGRDVTSTECAQIQAELLSGMDFIGHTAALSVALAYVRAALGAGVGGSERLAEPPQPRTGGGMAGPPRANESVHVNSGYAKTFGVADLSANELAAVREATRLDASIFEAAVHANRCAHRPWEQTPPPPHA